jgi:hypothetical protein
MDARAETIDFTVSPGRADGIYSVCWLAEALKPKSASTLRQNIVEGLEEPLILLLVPDRDSQPAA